MINRTVEIAGFLEQNGWADALDTPFAADFSPRRYVRLVQDDGRRAILMDADLDQRTDDFVVVAKLLKQLKITVPEIYVANPGRGLVLMEDLGNRNFGALLDRGEEAKPLYRRAVDFLVHMHKVFDKASARELDLPVFGGALFASQAEMFIDEYVPYVLHRDVTPGEGEGFRAAWKTVLKNIENLPQSLLLRDFMPDNLMDVPGRDAWRSVGVLDFQDAGLGPTAYDLASLCEVVRRDSGAGLLDDMICYYHQQMQPALSVEELTQACSILSAQRHTRILGIIARLAKKTGRNDKLSYLPRIRMHLADLLQSHVLKPVREWMDKTIPMNV